MFYTVYFLPGYSGQGAVRPLSGSVYGGVPPCMRAVGAVRGWVRAWVVWQKTTPVEE